MMSNFLETADRSLLLAINGLHSPFFDHLMWILSAKLAWIPVAILILYLAYSKLSTPYFVRFLCVAIGVVIIADVLSVSLLKETIQRYRPSHNLEIQHCLHLHINEDGTVYRGGKFGFVSSHATNFWAIACMAILSLGKHVSWFKWFMIGIASVVCYSRVYLGVHYPSDVLFGALFGSFIAYTSDYFLLKPKRMLKH